MKCGRSIYFFLNSANLICRDTDISKYFREFLGLRDNESRVYTPELAMDRRICNYKISFYNGEQILSDKITKKVPTLNMMHCN